MQTQVKSQKVEDTHLELRTRSKLGWTKKFKEKQEFSSLGQARCRRFRLTELPIFPGYWAAGGGE